MKFIKEMIKERFDLWVEMRWLKMIDKEANKYEKIKTQLSSQHHIINSLINKYEERYGKSLRK